MKGLGMKKLVFNIGFSVLLCCKSVFAEGETPLIVNDPEVQASQVTIIGKMVDSIKRYEEIISKAQAQVNQLEKVNNMINTTNSLISSSAITLANPMQVIQNAQYQLQSIRYNYENLKQSIENWNAQNLLRNKYLSQQCPWLNVNALTNNKIVNLKNLNNLITKNGEQTQTARDVQNLIQSLSSNGYENMQSLAGQLSGRAWGEMLCEEMTKADNDAEIALLKTRGQYKQAFIKQIKQNVAEEKRMSKKVKLLSKRLDALQTNFGVTDPTANHNKQGIPYCEENKETGKCDPIENVFRTTRLDNELEQEIQTLTLDLSKAPNKDAQSQAYANFNQRVRLLTVKYLKEITNQMLFLNQTMAMQSEIMADDYFKRYSNGYNTPKSQKEEELEEERINKREMARRYFQHPNVKFDQFGFPIFSIWD
ncbi:hypothetical protein [Helicobacter cetorum]|uniref:Uncharacterized protein n=2 Tax=Helicobacter cetorum TaxID=138563 RepID=I0EPN4_HELC0|nr:hypothetical protein [Helicobacter cetorum]ABS86837.1 hypothetical protein pz40w [Helicobacter cetorum]AFI04903.1 hypothetical protein HCW_08230 [Helicobacter cetorum MIT 00-7128]